MRLIFKRYALFLTWLVALTFFLAACTPDYDDPLLIEEEVYLEEVEEEEEPPVPLEEEPEEVAEEERWSDEEQIQAFDDFLEENFIEFVTFCILTLNSYVRNPENFGITDVPVTWEDFVTTESTEEGTNITLEWIETFDTFNREVLTPQQQESYDILAWQVESSLVSIETPMYYYRSSLRGSNGVHVLLPILLNEFSFYNQQDIDNYLQLLSEIEVVFLDAILLEEIRIERGLAMSDRVINEIIQETQGFIDNLTYNPLLTSFEFRMHHVDFLSREEIEDYIEQNRYIFLNDVVPAYENLIINLGHLLGNTDENLGLAHFPHGQEFYRLRFRAIGSSYTPAEWFDLIDQRFREVSDEYFFLMMMHPEINDYFAMGIHDFETPQELLAFQFIQASSSFPPMPAGVTYRIERIDESLGSFASGFYMVPQIDNYLSNVIYYNPNLADNNEFMYSLMAHEGLGHMLQFTTAFYSDLHNFRKINTIGFTGHVEGWAMHAQLYAYNFLNLSEVNHARLTVWDEFSVLYGAIIDIGVHYMGWGLEETLDYLNSIPLLEFIPDETLIDSFYSTIRNPARAVPYAIGLIEVRDLIQHFETALGDDFSMLTFNEAFLSKGPAPFPLVRNWLEMEFGIESDDGGMRRGIFR